MHTVLVLGGAGFFGARICASLGDTPDVRVLVAGRRAAGLVAVAQQLGLGSEASVVTDAHDGTLATVLRSHDVDTVVHTAGPFQGQDYGVARACIEAGANYIDIADGRDFVAGIGALDGAARARGVLVTSGASSLPALSSAVVDRYAPEFGKLESIRIGIGSGARSPGLATLRGIFGYCGKPFARLEDGAERTVHGWADTLRHHFPAPVGPRLLGNCDVPDLVLFPRRYPQVRTVTFHGGFAASWGHLAVALGAWAVRWRLLPSLAPLAPLLHAIARRLEPWVSDKGGMFVDLRGSDPDGAPLRRLWHLVAASNHGPHIPCGAAIALVRKLARGDALPCGARPCMGLLTLPEYLAALQAFDVREVPA
jgi:hypothetical protein